MNYRDFLQCFMFMIVPAIAAAMENALKTGNEHKISGKLVNDILFK